MTRPEFLAALEAALTEEALPVRRYTIEAGLEDLEIQTPDGVAHRLRIVRTGPR